MKKIFNIFASISLISTGTTAVVACSSHQNPNPPSPPTPPKSESQKLYDELNETKKPFLIKDDYFWGNEANYQYDLLTDLEKAANITTQQDKNLLHDTNVRPLTQQDGQTSEVQSVDINIDGIKDPAIVKIKWELTEAQSTPGLFDFYTKTWPQEIAKYGSNQIFPIFGGWYGKKFLHNVGDEVSWNTKIDSNITFQQYIEQYIGNIVNDFPNYLKPFIKLIPPTSIPKLNITEAYNIPLNNIYLSIPNPNDKKNPIKYNLGYYSSYDSLKPLPKMQNWQIGYNTYYNLATKELDNPKHAIGIEIDPNCSKASDPYNSQQIFAELSSPIFEPIINFYHTTFSGNLKSGVVVPIKVYYDNFYMGFNIYVYCE